MSAKVPDDHPYTCNTCRIGYRVIDLQKSHMRSDWHRYNLKRRVASLPPITAEAFSAKVLQARAETAEAQKVFEGSFCKACNKNFNSVNAFNNHLHSSKHKQNAQHILAASTNEENDALEAGTAASSTFSLGEPVKPQNHIDDGENEEAVTQITETISKTAISNEKETEDKEMTEEAPKTDPTLACLFCNQVYSDIDANVTHMERSHGTVIPEKAYLVNLPGLIRHLYKRIQEHNACIVCFKVKSNAYAVQTHMRDTAHCMIPFTTEEEQLDIGDFYDFRSTYSDGEEDEMDYEEDGGAKLGVSRPTKITNEDGEEIEEDGEGWETDSSVSSEDSDDIGAVRADGALDRISKHSHHTHDDPRGHRRADGYHSHAHKHVRAAFYDEYELHLPSGRAVGHRRDQKFYRQNLHNYPTPAERAEMKLLEAAQAEEEEETRGRHVIPRNERGLIGVTHDARREMQKQGIKHQKAARQHQAKQDYVVGVKLNKQKNYFYRYVNGG